MNLDLDVFENACQLIKTGEVNFDGIEANDLFM